jgi:hypothetical protein
MGACSSKASAHEHSAEKPVSGSSLEHRLQYHEPVDESVPAEATPDAFDPPSSPKEITPARNGLPSPVGIPQEESEAYEYILDLDGFPELETLSDQDEAKRAELSALIFGTPSAPISSEDEARIEKLLVGGHRKATMLRFLRARGMNVQKAHKMFKDALAWRVDSGTETMSDLPPLDAESLVTIRKCIPHSWLGFNADGFLVYVERSGQMDINRLFKDVTTADGKPDVSKLIRYHVHCMEYQQRVLLPMESKKMGRICDKICVINDLKGLGSHHLTRLTLGTLKKIARIDQDIYAECLGKLFIINAPWIFAAAWTIIKSFLDKRVQDKIFILSGSAEKQCETLIKEVGAEFVAFDKEKNEVRFLNPSSTDLEPIAGKDGNAIADSDGYITPMQVEMDAHFGLGGKLRAST